MIFRACLLGLCTASLAIASEPAAQPPRAEASFTDHPPTVDGVLEEAQWAEASPIVFPAKESQTPASEVRFLWADEGVYVAFSTKERTPVYGSFEPGKTIYQEDVFELFIDQTGDHKQYYEIQLSPAGQVFIKNYLLTAPPRLTEEGRLTPEFCDSEYWRYDYPVPEAFKVASKFDEKTGAWTLEAFLPASFVNRRAGGPPMKPTTWRVNLVRHDWDTPFSSPKREVKFFYWAPILEGHPHMSPTLMGYLELKAQK